MKIIYCADPINIANPDPVYIDEVAAATRAGVAFELLHYESLVEDDNPARAVRDIPVHDPVQSAVYRGWMLRGEQYAKLYDALLSRGLRLINTVPQYRHTHYLPEALEIIKAHTPRTVYMKTDGKDLSYDVVMQLLMPFDGQPLVLKDYVKSEKHYWNEACYIDSASDESNVRRVVENFLRLRGDHLEGGLVFREYVPFEPLGETHKSGMPLTKEYRIFFLHNQPIATVRYWDVEGYSDDDMPPVAHFISIARDIRSPFFTMDVAKTTGGEWMIVELGDAQVASLPKMSNVDAFYKALAGA